MKYRQLGNTDIKLSEVTFGPMRWRSKQEGETALEQAVEAGITTLHSSNEYGSMDDLAACLQTFPKKQRLQHIVKVNNPDHGEERFSAEAFRDTIEQTLKLLGTERIDVVQHLQRGKSSEFAYLPKGDERRLNEFDEVTNALTEVFGKMQQEGKVGALASFPYTTGFAEKAIDSGSFSALAAYFNPVEAEMFDFFPAMQEKHMSLIAIRPLLTGLLTEKRADRDSLPADDPFRDAAWDTAYETLAAVQKELKEQPDKLEELAVQFTLAFPETVTAVMGMNNAQQVASAVHAVENNALDQETARQMALVSRRHSTAVYSWPPYK